MAITLSDPAIYTDLQSLTELKRGAREQSDEALQETARQFEALFIQMLLKSMRAAGGAGGGLLDGEQSLFYRDLFDQQLALTLAKNGGLGLADVLAGQLAGEGATTPPTAAGPQSLERLAPPRWVAPPAGVRSEPSAGADRSGEAPPPVPGAEAKTATPPEARPSAPSSPEAFARQMWPHAEAAARRLGVSPAVLIAQAGLETGWGRSVPRFTDGRSSHNLFGIKADSRWGGARVANATLEFEGGVAQRRVEGFRAYASYAESFSDYVDFLRFNPRYKEALAVSGDAVAFVRALHRAGYATDSDYAAKIERILSGLGPDGAPGGLKSAAARPMSPGTG